MDINVTLENLMKKFLLNAKYKDMEKVKMIINQMIREIPKDYEIIIRGGGMHTEMLLDYLSDENFSRISYIVDVNKKINRINGIEVIDRDNWVSKEKQAVIVSSFAYKNDILVELFNKEQEMLVYDLYDYLKKDEISVNEPFYQTIGYEDIFFFKNKYLHVLEKKQKAWYLEQLIYIYLDIRDIVNAEKCMDEFLEKQFEGYEHIKQLKKELNKLLDDIHAVLDKRKEKDIIINWIDAFRCDEVEKTKFLANIQKKGMVFKEAYTVMPWTAATMRTIFSGKYIIDDKIYKIAKFTENNSIFLQILQKYGYKYMLVAGENDYRNIFEKKNITRSIRRLRGGYISSETMPFQQWQALNERINCEKKLCCIIHNLSETHQPYMSGELSHMNKYLKYDQEWRDEGEIFKQISESRIYIDRQLEWYHQFYNENNIMIYMSDHGKEDKRKGYRNNNKLKVVFMIEGKEFENYKENRMFSYVNMSKMLEWIITKKNYDDIFSEYVKIQCLDYYNEKAVLKLIEEKFDVKEWMQFRGIKTKQDFYLRYVDGREEYYVYPEEYVNQINNSKYKKRIEKLKEINGEVYVDILKEPYFYRIKEIYHKLGII